MVVGGETDQSLAVVLSLPGVHVPDDVLVAAEFTVGGHGAAKDVEQGVEPVDAEGEHHQPLVAEVLPPAMGQLVTQYIGKLVLTHGVGGQDDERAAQSHEQGHRGGRGTQKPHRALGAKPGQGGVGALRRPRPAAAHRPGEAGVAQKIVEKGKRHAGKVDGGGDGRAVRAEPGGVGRSGDGRGVAVHRVRKALRRAGREFRRSGVLQGSHPGSLIVHHMDGPGDGGSILRGHRFGEFRGLGQGEGQKARQRQQQAEQHREIEVKERRMAAPAVEQRPEQQQKQRHQAAAQRHAQQRAQKLTHRRPPHGTALSAPIHPRR